MQIDASTTALVTGATGGIGLAIARALHQAGARLVLTGRRVETLAPLAQETGARVLRADLADRASVEQLITECGPINLLIANAALPGSGPLLDFAPHEVDRALEVNLRAPIRMAHAFAPAMVERRRGHIV